MSAATVSDVAPTRVRGYMWGMCAAWVVVVLASLVWSLYQQREGNLGMARAHARTAHEKDLIYRRWIASHGGVYVPVTEETQPNPYLEHLPERDITTPSGRLLTLMHPAHMTRQLNELGEQRDGVRGHITSLAPIRPENAADPWETEALRAFEEGEKEVSSVAELGGKSYMRLMRPLVTEQVCLECHEGYQVGEIRGGISVSVPMAPLRALGRNHTVAMVVGHAVLGLLGLAGIIAATVSLGQRVAESDRLKQELSHLERLRATRDLAAGISHNLNNILTGVMLPLDILQHQVDDPAVSREVESISAATRRAADLVQRLNRAVRCDRDGAVYAVSVETPLREALEKARQRCREAGENRRVAIETTGDLAEIPPIAATSAELVEVLNNLLLNAAEAMPEGGTITVRSGVDDTCALLAVCDEGMGMDEETRTRLFEPFFTTKADVGRGLGLSTVYGTVTRWGGNVEVESSPGQGATFTLRLPLWVEPRPELEEKERELSQRDSHPRKPPFDLPPRSGRRGLTRHAGVSGARKTFQSG